MFDCLINGESTCNQSKCKSSPLKCVQFPNTRTLSFKLHDSYLTVNGIKDSIKSLLINLLFLSRSY